MRISTDSFRDGERLPEKLAYGAHDPAQHVRPAGNRNPHLAWSDLPEGTRSLVLVCHDSDVPTEPDDVNQEGRTVPASLLRTDFYHWVLVDVDPGAGEIAEGSHSDGVTPRGKGPEAPHGRHGLNDFTAWFAGDPENEGQYFGYDGPCPPWNDELLHHYHFTLYATDLDRCPVDGAFRGPEVLEAIEGHVLGQARLTGTYAIYPNAK